MWKRARRTGGWIAAMGTLGLLIIYGLNLPFSVGAEGPTCQWRMEEGRLWLMHGEARAPNPLWLAAGSGRLRLGWVWSAPAPGTWRVAIPLWAPLLPMAGLSAWALWKCRSDAWRCPTCGYDLRAIKGDTCPECGKRRETPVNDA